MVKRSKLLYVFLAVLGTVFLAPLFSSILQGGINTSMIMMVMFLSIVGTVFLATGIIGVGSQCLKGSQNLSASQSKLAGDSKKHFRLYVFVAVLGIVFLGTFLTLGYWSGVSGEVNRFFCSTPLAGFLVFVVFLVGGTGFLTVGVCGIGRRYFKHKSLFAMLIAIVIPSLILMPFFYVTLVAPFEDMFPLRSKITHVTVVDASPLVLSVGVKAITSSDSRIDQAFVTDSENEFVAETSLGDREWVEYNGFKGLALAVLPAGSEITLILNFNASLPSGNYTVRLSSWGVNHGRSSFTVP